MRKRTGGQDARAHHDAHTQGKDTDMSQSTRSGSKLANRASHDEAEVRDALLDRTDGSGGSTFDQLDAAEERPDRP